MRRILNVLYVMTSGAYLSLENDNIVMNVDHEVRFKYPVNLFESILCMTKVSVSPYLMHFCAMHGVAISFVSEHGKFLARVDGPVRGNVLLRRQQYRMADDPAASLHMAQTILAAKIANSRSVLMRFARETSDPQAEERVRGACSELAISAASASGAKTLDELRGTEGEAARKYFAVFDDMITTQKESFAFGGRSKRPPLDRVNAMLSFVYTLLAHDIASALEGVGLDPCVGFLHRDRPGRPSLALDVMEEFRANTADRLVLSLINRKQVAPEGFEIAPDGAVTMSDETRKTIIKTWQERKQDAITHPFVGDKMHAGLVPHIQARLLARKVRGDIAEYPPFVKR